MSCHMDLSFVISDWFLYPQYFVYPMRCQRVNSKMIQYKRMLVVLKLKEMAEIIDAVGSTHLTLRKIAKNFLFFSKKIAIELK